MSNKKIYLFVLESMISSIFFLGGATLLRSGHSSNNQEFTYAGAACFAIGAIGTLDSVKRAQDYKRGK